MNTIEICWSCSSSIPDEAKYCPQCAIQLKCKNCDGYVLKNAKACIHCGSLLSISSLSNSDKKLVIQQVLNIIKFNENKDGLIFEAQFTDKAIQNFSDSFSVITNKIKPRLFKKDEKFNPKSEIFDESTEQEQIENLQLLDEPKISNDEATELHKIKKIFKFNEDKVIQQEPRLKATNKIDYAKKLTILFIFANTFIGKENVTRKEIVNVLKTATVYDDYTSRLISKSNDFLTDGEQISLSIPGLEKAKEYLEETFNNGMDDKWMPGNNKAKSPKKATSNINDNEETNFKIKKKIKQTNTYLEDLKLDDLSPFMEKFIPNNNYERNLIFIYFLKEILKEDKINEDHIYTCYRKLGVKIPGNLTQSIFETKYRKLWIDLHKDDIKITSKGINVAEHEINKKV